jgi:hypothetical protein
MLPESIDVAQQEAQAAKEGYVHRCLVAIDICANVILFRGRQGETISAHAYRAALLNKLWGRILNGALCIIQKDHGAKACAGDLERATSIAATEEKILK